MPWAKEPLLIYVSSYGHIFKGKILKQITPEGIHREPSGELLNKEIWRIIQQTQGESQEHHISSGNNFFAYLTVVISESDC